MADDSIPQAPLPTLRRFLTAARSQGDFLSAGKSLGLQKRHIEFHRIAAEVLQLARRDGSVLRISALGQRLLATAAHTQEEAAVWREAIEKCPIVMRVATELLDPRGISKAELTKRLMREGTFTTSTARGRAEALLGWRKYVREGERQVALPFTSRPGSPAPLQYEGNATLRSVRIQSFKAFGQPKAGAKGTATPIEMAPLTVLVGPNGAGKSTILQALDILGALVRGSITDMLKAHGWDYADLPHLLSAKQTITIEVVVELGEAVVAWELSLGARKYPGIASESVRARGRDETTWRPLLERQGRAVQITHESTHQVDAPPLITLAQSWLGTLDAKDDATKFPGLLALKAWAEGIHAFWSLSPEVLRSPSRGTSDRVGPRGEDLASFLFRLKKSREKQFAAFVQRVRRHYPRLVRIEPRSGQYGWKHLTVTERWNGEEASFNVRQVSDGLLRMMVVASLLDWKVPPSLVLLDEVENGLHPRLIGGIAELLTEISAKTQVVTTTHSPITLNYVPAEAARLVTRGKGGTVVVTPLVETKNYGRLREHFEPGELWYNVGEDRLLETRRSK